jgi:hypothetical protein
LVQTRNVVAKTNKNSNEVKKVLPSFFEVVLRNRIALIVTFYKENCNEEMLTEVFEQVAEKGIEAVLSKNNIRNLYKKHCEDNRKQETIKNENKIQKMGKTRIRSK